MKKLVLAILSSALLASTAYADSANAGTLPGESALDRVLQTRLLRVCTTGDYKPYTYMKKDGSYEGIDIGMAQSLAKSLDVDLEFVPTTWKNLMPDFLNGNCDIAMGGVSISLARQQKVSFATALDVDGKIPFVRCEDVEKYDTLEKLNQKDVRAIEPAGGTNEAFVRQFMPEAQLELFHDNTTIFQSLVDKKADVMITDKSEVLYQKAFYPDLCAVNPDHQLTFAEKAYMLPRGDTVWKDYVDQWLRIAKSNGEYHKIAAEWLGGGK